MAAPKPFLLGFTDIWERFASRPFKYDELIHVTGSKGTGLLAFRDRLNYTRAAAFASPGGDPSAAMAACEEYIGCVSYLLENKERLLDVEAARKRTVAWVSAMVPPNFMGPWLIHLEAMPTLDRAMMVQFWAFACWQQAQRRVAAAFAGSEPPAGTVLPENIELLRRAAGMFRYLAEQMWPFLATEGGGGHVFAKDNAPEVHTWFANACSHACLGQAQQLVAFRSFCKGTAYGLTAQLYVAASNFFERASDVMRDAEKAGYKPATDRFKRFMALCSTLCVARARCCQVWALMAEHEAGKACVQANHALNELNLCTYVAEGDSAWLATLALARQEVEETSETCDVDRRNVHMQLVADTPPRELPSGTAVVAPLDFTIPYLPLSIDPDE